SSYSRTHTHRALPSFPTRRSSDLETRRFEELEDERWQRAQHQLDVRGGRGMTRVDENVEPGGIDVADVGEIDDECRGPARQRPAHGFPQIARCGAIEHT